MMWLPWLLLVPLYMIIPIFLFWRHNGRRRNIRQLFIFHPLADARGGGEKCLWAFLTALCNPENAKQYTRKPLRLTLLVKSTTPHVKTLIAQAEDAFGLEFPTFFGETSYPEESRDFTRLTSNISLKLIRLDTVSLAFQQYGFATQFLQLVGGLCLGFEAALKTRGTPHDYIIDTTGLPAATLAYSWCTCFLRRRTYTYTHWPWISPDLREERGKKLGLLRRIYASLLFNFVSFTELAYNDPIVVNSTFTRNGLKELWPRRKPQIQYPPITKSSSIAKSNPSQNPLTIISVAQFRPEKNHKLQITIFKRFLTNLREQKKDKIDISGIVFKICGSLRPRSADADYFIELQKFAAKDLEDLAVVTVDRLGEVTPNKARLVFYRNLDSGKLRRYISESRVGIHTMKNEHLGIAVAEFAYDGLWVVAHKSAGPRDDILRAPDEREVEQLPEHLSRWWRENTKGKSLSLGSLCESVEEFARGIEQGLFEQDALMREVTRSIVNSRFPDEKEFGKALVKKWALFQRPVKCLG